MYPIDRSNVDVCRHFVIFKEWYDYVTNRIQNDIHVLNQKIKDTSTDALYDAIEEYARDASKIYKDHFPVLKMPVPCRVYIIEKPINYTDRMHHSIYWYAFYIQNTQIIDLILLSIKYNPQMSTAKYTIYNALTYKPDLLRRITYYGYYTNNIEWIKSVFPDGLLFDPLYAICKLVSQSSDMFLDKLYKFIDGIVTVIDYWNNLQNEHIKKRFALNVFDNFSKNNWKPFTKEEFVKQIFNRLQYDILSIGNASVVINILNSDQAKNVLGAYYSYYTCSDVTYDMITYTLGVAPPISFDYLYGKYPTFFNVDEHVISKCNEGRKYNSLYVPFCFEAIAGDNLVMLQHILDSKLYKNKLTEQMYMNMVHYCFGIPYTNNGFIIRDHYFLSKMCLEYLLSSKYEMILSTYVDKHRIINPEREIVLLTSFSSSDIVNEIILFIVNSDEIHLIPYLKLFIRIDDIKRINVLDPAFFDYSTSFTLNKDRIFLSIHGSKAEYLHTFDTVDWLKYPTKIKEKLKMHTFLYFIYKGMDKSILDYVFEVVDRMTPNIDIPILEYKLLKFEDIPYMQRDITSIDKIDAEYLTYVNNMFSETYTPIHKREEIYIQDYKPYDTIDNIDHDSIIIKYNCIGKRHVFPNFTVNDYNSVNRVYKYILHPTIRTIWGFVDSRVIASMNIIDLSVYPFAFTWNIIDYLDAYKTLNNIKSTRVLKLPFTSSIGKHLELLQYITNNCTYLEVLAIRLDFIDYRSFSYIFWLLNKCSKLHTLILELNDGIQDNTLPIVSKNYYKDNPKDFAIFNTTIKHLTINVRGTLSSSDRKTRVIDYSLPGIVQAFESLESIDFRRNNISIGLPIICAPFTPFNSIKLTKLKYVYVKYYNIKDEVYYLERYLRCFYIFDEQENIPMVYENNDIDDTYKIILTCLTHIYTSNMHVKNLSSPVSDYNAIISSLNQYETIFNVYSNVIIVDI